MTVIRKYILPSLLVFILCVVGIGFDSQPVQASSQILFSGYPDALPNTDTWTEQNTLSGGYVWSGTAFAATQVISSSGKLKNLRVELSANVAGGGYYTFTVLYDGAGSAVTFNIATGASSGNSGVLEVDVVAGHTISLACHVEGTITNTPTAQWSAEFSGSNANESLLLTGAPCATAANRYAPLLDGSNTIAAGTEADTRMVCPTSGSIKNLYVILSADPGDPAGPDGYRFTLRVGAASKALTCTISADSTTGSDLVNSVAVVAGDILTVMIEPINGPSVAPTAQIGMTFAPTIDGESLLGGGSFRTLSASVVKWNYLVRPHPWLDGLPASEAASQQLGQVCVLKKLYVLLTAAPNNGAGTQSYIIMLRNNAADTAVTTTISEAATTGNSGVLETTLAAGDNVNLSFTPSGTPTVSGAYYGLVCYIAPPATRRSFGIIIGKYDILEEVESILNSIRLGNTMLLGKR
jgi:hypothetical protein